MSFGGTASPDIAIIIMVMIITIAEALSADLERRRPNSLM
jgi:hypothetical protein